MEIVLSREIFFQFQINLTINKIADMWFVHTYAKLPFIKMDNAKWLSNCMQDICTKVKESLVTKNMKYNKQVSYICSFLSVLWSVLKEVRLMLRQGTNTNLLFF